MFYEETGDQRVLCRLCPHGCSLKPGAAGACRVRKNIGGTLYSTNYACISSIALDPIEKKPLYHFHPGKRILSVGTLGCNFKCSYCQNWSIAQSDTETTSLEPADLAELSVQYIDRGNIGVAYTYNEPSVWFEYVLETSRIIRQKGLVNVLVTNGFICKEPLDELLPFTDAMNIDVKAFTQEYYDRYCKGTLETVKESVERAARSCHVEITTLVIPGLNDSPAEIGKLAKWLSSISSDIVLHLSRFFPHYKMLDIPPTPVKTLEEARDSALSYLKYVYLGNV
jgi:pyruvate formate lyase activating enzyme